jgi:hypothetical protein
MSTHLLFNQSLLQGHGMLHSKRWMDLDDDGKPLRAIFAPEGQLSILRPPTPNESELQ